MMRQELMPIANPEHRYACCKNRRIDIGASRLVDAAWAARDNQAAPACQTLNRRFTGLYVGKHAQFSHFSCDEMRVLSACIKDRDLRRGSRRGLVRHGLLTSKGGVLSV